MGWYGGVDRREERREGQYWSSRSYVIQGAKGKGIDYADRHGEGKEDGENGRSDRGRTQST